MVDLIKEQIEGLDERLTETIYERILNESG